MHVSSSKTALVNYFKSKNNAYVMYSNCINFILNIENSVLHIILDFNSQCHFNLF